MTKEQYMNQRQQLLNKAKGFIVAEDFENFNKTQKEVEDLDANYYALQALLLLYETQEVDAMLMDQVAMENFLRQEIYLDLRQLLSEDSLAAMGEAVIWARHKESSEAAPLVLDVTELPFIQDHTEATGRVYLAFMNNTTHLPACRLLWDAITAWEDKK